LVSITLREEHRLKVFENRVLRGIFGLKKEEVMGEWRKLLIGKLNNLFSSPNFIRQVNSKRMKWVGHVARMGEEKKVWKVFVGKPEGKRPLGRPVHGWEDGIKIDWLVVCAVDSAGSGWGPMAGSCEHGDEPLGSDATEVVS
jgi:hypothetical protein